LILIVVLEVALIADVALSDRSLKPRSGDDLPEQPASGRRLRVFRARRVG